MPNTELRKLDILVCDPSTHMQSLIGQMLRHLQVGRIDLVATSQEAQAALNRHAYGAILVDDALLPLDGIGLTRALRSNSGSLNRDTAVIMMSAEPSSARIATARDAGVSEFLRKPFAAHHIETRLRAVLRAPRAFIESGAYTGPDRRRHPDDYEGIERRTH